MKVLKKIANYFNSYWLIKYRAICLVYSWFEYLIHKRLKSILFIT